MRKISILIGIIALVLLSGCTNYLKSYTFEDLYVEVRKIDSKYDTVLQVEQLGALMVPREKIQPMVLELEALQHEVNNTRMNDDRDTINTFLDARILMLESQGNFQTAAKIGVRGLATDGYRCSEVETIAKSRIYLRESLSQAQQAWGLLDLVIQDEKTRTYLGVNENRPRFYDSPLRQIQAEMNAQKAAILKCMQDAGVDQATLEQQFGNPLMNDTTNETAIA